MVFQSNFILVPTIVYSGSTVDSQFRPRLVKNSATASASRLEHLGLLILPILRSGAYVYIRAYSQYACVTAAGPVTLYAICVLVYATCI